MNKVSKSLHKEKRRVDAELNESIVVDEFMEMFVETKKRPTSVALSKRLGLSRPTTDKHIKNVSRYIGMGGSKWKERTPLVMNAIFQQAIKGNVAAQKLFLQVVENWREGMDISGTVKHDNLMDLLDSMSRRKKDAPVIDAEVKNNNGGKDKTK